MDSVRSARSRLSRLPSLVAECSLPAAEYAQCVSASMAAIKKDQCAKEFKAFQECVKKAAAKK